MATTSWTEKDGIIRFTVTSNGLTGPQWIERLEASGKDISGYAKSLLRSPKFKPTKGVTYNVAVFMGKLYAARERFTSNILADAKKRKCDEPEAELSCLIRDAFSNADIRAMGLEDIIPMHEPIEDSDGGLPRLGACTHGHSCSLRAFGADPDREWVQGIGFAFVSSQQ
jgi:hypothetical protein